MAKITETEAAGLRTWKDEAKAFLDEEFPKTRISLGITALDGGFTVSAEVHLPCHDKLTDIRAAFGLLGITSYMSTGTPEAQ